MTDEDLMAKVDELFSKVNDVLALGITPDYAVKLVHLAETYEKNLEPLLEEAEKVKEEVVKPLLRQPLKLGCGAAYVAMNILAIQYNTEDSPDSIYAKILDIAENKGIPVGKASDLLRIATKS